MALPLCGEQAPHRPEWVEVKGEANGKTVYTQPNLQWLLIRNSLPQVAAWTHDLRTGARGETINGCVHPKHFSCSLRMERHGVTLSESLCGSCYWSEDVPGHCCYCLVEGSMGAEPQQAPCLSCPEEQAPCLERPTQDSQLP